MKVLGSGAPLRQFVYSIDVGLLLIWMLFNYNDEEPLILTSNEEISIGDLAQLIVNAWGGNIEIQVLSFYLQRLI